jgi:glycosyltransferase involved in cell wall biosynthesis
MKIILNGMGCPYSGARLVLMELLKTVPKNLLVLAVVPKVHKNDTYLYDNPNIKFVKMNVKYWSLYLRPFLEIWINVVKILFKYDAVINVSNYGLCLTNNQVLYIHNQYIVDMKAKQQFGGGYPNIINRFGLNTFLKKASAIFVQSNHIYNTLKEYCRTNNITFPANVKVLTPHPMIDESVSYKQLEKKYPFQFFYPASDFEHKRVDLAVESIKSYHKTNPDVGLIITSADKNDLHKSIDYLKQVPHQIVLENTFSCHAIIFTSEREALGLPLLEALFFGKPAVLPNLPYAKEIFGNAGVYFNSFNVNEIHGAINELYCNYDKYVALTTERKKELWQKLKSWEEHWHQFISNIEKKY